MGHTYNNQRSLHTIDIYITVGQGTVFLLINAPGAMRNIDREPLFCTEFTKQKVCPILYLEDV